jgi:hypothetical protein
VLLIVAYRKRRDERDNLTAADAMNSVPPARQIDVATSEARRTIVVRLEGGGAPDLGMIDALARMQLAARRVGWKLQVRTACPELCELIELAGLDEVLALEPLGQAEHREELGVEEVVEPADPVS